MALRELVVSLGFEFDKASLDKIDNGIKEIRNNLLAVGLAASGAAATVFGFAKATADSANNIRRTAAEIGMGTTDLQVLGNVAETSGASFDEMAGGLRSLVGAMNAARLGSGTQADAFRRLGITFKNANGELLPVVEVYAQLADRMKMMQDGTKKTAIASDILGGSAGKLMETLSKGSEAMREAGINLESFGGIIDEAGFKQAQAFSQGLQQLMVQVKAVGRAVGFALMPVVSSVVKMMQSWVSVNRELIKNRITAFTNILIDGLHRLFRIGRSVVEVVTALYKGIEYVLKPLGGLETVLRYAAYAMGLFVAGRTLMALSAMAGGVFGIAKALNLVNLKALLIPILIAAAAAAIYLIVDDIVAFVEGRPSFLGYLLKNKDKILAQLKEWFLKAKKFVLDFVEKGITLFFEFFGVPQDQAKIAAAKIREVLENLFNVLQAIVTGQLGIIVSLFGDAVKLIVDLITKPKETFENLGARFAEIFGNLLRAGLASIEGISKAISGLFGVDSQKFEKVWSSFRATALSVIAYVQEKLGGIFEGIKGVVVGVGDFIFYLLSQLIKGVVMLINKPMELLSSLGDKIAAPFKELAKVPANIKMIWDAGDKIPFMDTLTSSLGIGQNATPANAASFLGGGTPTVPFAQPPASNTATVNFQSNINVTAPPGSDAAEIGEIIKRTSADEFAKALGRTSTVVAPTIKY